MAERFAHEPTDTPARVPAWTALITVVLVGAFIALIAGLMSSVWAPAPPGPAVFRAPEQRGPAPALQQNPQADFDRLRRRWRERLQSYGWVDRRNGIVHIPIDAAMDRVAVDGKTRRGRQR